jgi:hypothetical protein
MIDVVDSVVLEEELPSASGTVRDFASVEM